MFGRCLLIVLAAPLVSLAGSDSPAEFSQTRAMADVRFLAALKSRTAGTNGESRAIQYVKEKLRGAGLDVWTEPFFFRSYDLDHAVLRIGDVSAQPTRIVFDPYRGATDIKGDVVFVTAATVNGKNGLAGLDVSQRVVVTTKEAQFYRIADLAPRPSSLCRITTSRSCRGQGRDALRCI